MQSWYSITNKADTNEAEIRIYDEIGFFGVTARRFADDLENITADTIHVRLNTPGGDAFDGIAIGNALKAHSAKIVMHIDGLAASAGSVIAMAGDEVHMADNAFLMIHNSAGGVWGGAEDMKHYAEVLDKLNDSIALTYQARAGQTRKYWRGKMAEETWFTASEAKAEGLVDSIDSAAKAENRFDFKIYNCVPEEARKLWGKTQPVTQISAPEPSPSGGVAPVSQSQEPTMATDSTSAPAQPPVAGSGAPAGETASSFTAQAIEGYINRGRALGKTEGEQAAQERMKSIFAACPKDPQMAINAFLSGQTADAVKLAYDAAQNAEARRYAEKLEHDREVARLQALIATGGHPGVNISVSNDPAPTATGGAIADMDPVEQANMEWDSNPLIRAKNKEREWKLFRVAQLKGNVRAFAKSA